MDWTATTAADWVDLSATAGTLAPAATDTLWATFNGQAMNLSAGGWDAALEITDLTHGKTQMCHVFLKVEQDPGDHLGHWKFDESTGATTAFDSSGLGYHATLVGSPAFGSGMLGNALILNGTDQHAVAGPLNLNSNNATITAWIRSSTTQTSGTGIFYNGECVDTYGTDSGLLCSSNELSYTWNGTTWASSLEVPNDQWTFVALTVEPEKGTLYIHDGTAPQSESNYTVHDPATFSYSTYIGFCPHWSGSHNYHFNRKIDDVQFFDFALSEQQLECVHRGAMPTLPSPFNRQTGVATSPTLTWEAGPTADSHNVYFGLGREAVRNADTGSLEYQGNQTGTSYDPGSLEPETPYFWRIDPIISGTPAYPSFLWSFKTGRTPERLGHWKFDESTGASTAFDSSGLRHQALLVADPALTSGTLGNALRLASVTERGRISGLGLNSDSATITGWIKRNGSQTAWARIFWNVRYWPDQYGGLHFGTANELCYTWAPDVVNFNSGFVVPDNTWVFVTLTVEPDQATLQMNNGTILSSTTNLVSHSALPFNDNTYIGCDPWNIQHFLGDVDDVQVFDFALSNEQLECVRRGRMPTLPSPYNGQTRAGTDSTLTWEAGPTATGHNVYFGTSLTEVQSATPTSPEFKDYQTATTYDPGILLPETCYFWRIDPTLPIPDLFAITSASPGIPHSGDYMVGWSFIATEYIEVTSVGFWDEYGDGLNTTHRVGIWSLGGSTKWVDHTIPAGTGTGLAQGFRFDSLAAPVILPAATYVIAANTTSGGDQYLYSATTSTTGPIVYQDGRFEYDPTFAYPPRINTTSLDCYFGPNFKFNPTASAYPGLLWFFRTEPSPPTQTPTATNTFTHTPTSTSTFTPTLTSAPTFTFTPTSTFTPTVTPSPTPTVDPSLIWVDFDYSGTEIGTAIEPFNTLAEGVDAVTPGGTIRIKAGVSGEILEITKAVRIEAPEGEARIGVQ